MQRVSLGTNGAVTATWSLPAQLDLSCLTQTDPAPEQQQSLQATHSGKGKEFKKKKPSGYLTLWIPLSTILWSSPAFPSLQEVLASQAPREKLPRQKEEKKDTTYMRMWVKIREIYYATARRIK